MDSAHTSAMDLPPRVTDRISGFNRVPPQEAHGTSRM